MYNKFMAYVFIVLCAVTVSGCNPEETVVIYTSVDRNYSEQVFNEFENRTGIKVLAVYDTEASKTTGLVNRLVEEKNHPIADVFWNGEFAQTILLKKNEVLAPYQSENAKGIPDNYKDSEGYWTAFGGRGRCFLINTEKMIEADYPSSISDLLNDDYEAKRIGMAYPFFGTSATQAAALFSLWGTDKAEDFYQAVYDRNVRIVDGNSAVRDLVVSGELIFGLTDTDDAIGAIKKGAPVTIIFPDQDENDIGTLFIPNTVGLIAGTSNEKNAKQFIDFLLSVEIEAYLIEIGWNQVALREVDSDFSYFNYQDIKVMDLTLKEVYENIEHVKGILNEVYIR